jgi:hypothetical protein
VGGVLLGETSSNIGTWYRVGWIVFMGHIVRYDVMVLALMSKRVYDVRIGIDAKRINMVTIIFIETY